MILDHIDNADTYADIHPAFAEAFAVLRRDDLSQLPEGRFAIGDGLYGVVAKGPGRKPDQAQIETHDKYIDIQYVIDGVDTMGWKARNDLGAAEKIDSDGDVAFYGDTPTVWTEAAPGMFAIYFPEDGHLPMIAEGSLHKVIIKVRI